MNEQKEPNWPLILVALLREMGCDNVRIQAASIIEAGHWPEIDAIATPEGDLILEIRHEDNIEKEEPELENIPLPPSIIITPFKH